VSAALVGLLVGFAIGVAALLLLRPRLEDSRARTLFDRWVAAESRRAVRLGVDDQRAGTKRRLGQDLAPQLPTFPFEAADARFLGHPAHFVIFDGHTNVKDRRSDELREIVFVTVRSEHADLADAELIDECLQAGRVRWSTLRPETGPPGLSPMRSVGRPPA
jgi:predicted Holliday junction resolvase-like endonuclease